MTCLKCQGLIVTEHGERRCLNCGYRPDVTIRPATEADGAEGVHEGLCSKCHVHPPVSGRKMCRRCLDIQCDYVRMRDHAQKGITTMPRFKTEEGKQRWLAAMEKRRGEKKSTGGGTSIPAVVEPKALPVSRPVEMRGQVLSVLEAAILDAHADVAALERTREILSR